MISIVVFARCPTPGRVKTRLAATIGAERAAEIYKILLRHTLSVCVQLPRERFRTVLYLEPTDSSAAFRAHFPEFSDDIVLQEGADLGARLTAAVQREAAYGAVACIGSDCPRLAVRHFEETERALVETPLVLGPADDGGYWLVALARPAPELFTQISWSTAEVFPQTLARAKKLRLDFSLLERLSDVDTEDDAKLAGLL